MRARLLPTLLLAAACGGSAEGEISGETWIGDCSAERQQKRVVFSGSMMALYIDAYPSSGVDCTGARLFTGTTHSTISVGGASAVVAGATEVDVTATAIGLIPRDDSWLGELRARPGCSALDWTLGGDTSLAGTTCLLDKPWPTVPQPTRYVIMQKSATQLVLWKTGIACLSGQPCYGGETPETRVRELDAAEPLRPL